MRVHETNTENSAARRSLPPGWTAEIVDGETVFRSPTGSIETSDADRVTELRKEVSI